MKILVLLFVVCLVACDVNDDFMSDVKFDDFTHEVVKSKSMDWNKPYSPKEIVELKKYVKSIDNRLFFTKDLSFALDSLRVCQQAYEDLQKNLMDVNEVLEIAERDSFVINLQYPPVATTRSGSAWSYTFVKNKQESVYEYSRFKNSEEVGGTKKTRLAIMSANSSCSFLSKTYNVDSRTFVNTSIFLWAFVIRDDKWGYSNGKSGVGVIGEDHGYVEFAWIYPLDYHLGEFGWKFSNTSSNTDGVSISHQFWGIAKN